MQLGDALMDKYGRPVVVSIILKWRVDFQADGRGKCDLMIQPLMSDHRMIRKLHGPELYQWNFVLRGDSV